MYNVTLTGNYDIKFRFLFWTKEINGELDENFKISSVSFRKEITIPGPLPISLVVYLDAHNNLGVEAAFEGFVVYQHAFPLADVVKSKAGLDLMPFVKSINDKHGIHLGNLVLNVTVPK
jgi:hypothetical protein